MSHDFLWSGQLREFDSCSPSPHEKEQETETRVVEDESSPIFMLNTSIFISRSDPSKAAPWGHWSEGCLFTRRTTPCSKIHQTALFNVPKQKQHELGVPTSFKPPLLENRSPDDSELVKDTPPHPYRQDQACSLLISNTDPTCPQVFSLQRCAWLFI